MQQFRAGMVKVFGVLANKRWTGAPDVPTLAEGGLPGDQIEFWHGLWAPKGTPKDIVAKLSDAVSAAFADPAVQKRLPISVTRCRRASNSRRRRCWRITRPSSIGGGR